MVPGSTTKIFELYSFLSPGFSFSSVTLNNLRTALSHQTSEMFISLISLCQQAGYNAVWIQFGRVWAVIRIFAMTYVSRGRSWKLIHLRLIPAREDQRSQRNPFSFHSFSFLVQERSSFPSSITTAPCWLGRERLEARGEVQVASSGPLHTLLFTRSSGFFKY